MSDIATEYAQNYDEYFKKAKESTDRNALSTLGSKQSS